MSKKLILVLLLFPSLLFAQYQRPGSTDAQFLKIGVSARAEAMSGAYIAVVTGAEATYYNPAALARIDGSDVVFNHTKWFAGINHDFVAAAHTFEHYGTFGISMTALYTDAMKVRTPLQPDGTGETFYANNYRVGISYSRYLTDRVTFGGTLNYINMSLYSGFSANAYSVDIAILYTTQFHGFRFGMRIANFGSEVKYVNESYPLPTNFNFGLAMNVIDTPGQKLLMSFSALKPNDGQPLGQIGAEWDYHNIIFARTGYRINYDVAGYSFGGGLLMNIQGYQLRFDYSFSNFILLGGAHRFGIGLSF